MLLLSVPKRGLPVPPDLSVQLQEAIEQRLGCRRASRHVQVNGNDPVTTPDDRVRVVVVSTSVSARAHRDDPSRFGHLVVHLSQRRCHLVGQGTCDDHAVRLTRRRTENHTQAILIVSCGGNVHHLYGAARETKRHGPETRLTCPVGHLVHRRKHVLDAVLGRLERELVRAAVGHRHERQGSVGPGILGGRRRRDATISARFLLLLRRPSHSCGDLGHRFDGRCLERASQSHGWLGGEACCSPM